MKKLILALFAVLITVSCQTAEEAPIAVQPVGELPELWLDLMAIAGESPAAVEQLLGAPTSTKKVVSTGKEYPKLVYRDGEVAVVYVNDSAAWLTIYPPTKLPFRKTSLAALGLPVSEPSLRHPLSMMRWTDYQNLREITFFANTGVTIRYISICVIHCP